MGPSGSGKSSLYQWMRLRHRESPQGHMQYAALYVKPNKIAEYREAEHSFKHDILTKHIKDMLNKNVVQKLNKHVTRH